jgi:hypothetical protein
MPPAKCGIPLDSSCSPLRNRAMRITQVSTTIVNAEMRNWIFVRVDTDSHGLYGWGESTCEWKTRAVAGAIGDLEPLLIGRDPRDIEQLVRVMKKHSFWRLGIIGMSAISGIDAGGLIARAGSAPRRPRAGRVRQFATNRPPRDKLP